MPAQAEEADSQGEVAPEGVAGEGREPWGFSLRQVAIAILAGVVIVVGIWLLEGGPGGEGGQATAGDSRPVKVGAAAGPAPRIGQPAPDFALRDLEGQVVRLPDLRGQAVFLNFWATWCPPCRAEMPDIDAVYRQYKDQGLVVLAIDFQEAPDTVRRYAQSLGLTFVPLIDPAGEVFAQYRVTALPTSFFIDRQGIIRAVQIGAMSKKTILAQVGKIL